jgi:hypothetical protein
VVSKSLAATLLLSLAACQPDPPDVTEVDRLYLTATMGANHAAALEAVKALGVHTDPKADELLVRIATITASARDDRVAVEAVRQLLRRGSANVIPVLVALLTPESTLELRQAVAEALAALGCSKECMPGILSYLERVWAGEANDEQRLVAAVEDRKMPDEMARTVVPRILERQQQVYETLYEILREQPDELAGMLQASYGLGTSSPSAFALHLVAFLQLSEACPALVETQKRLGVQHPELVSAIREAGC